MADAIAFFVQFPHPGGEHHPPIDDMPWNVTNHPRKFLVAHGRHLDDHDRVGEGDLAFWGEWEPVGIGNPDSITPRRRSTRGSAHRADPVGERRAD
jgi:hypothetical protein